MKHREKQINTHQRVIDGEQTEYIDACEKSTNYPIFFTFRDSYAILQ
jgi:hypothetical protein